MIDRRAVPRGDEQIAARVLRAEIAGQRGQYQVAHDALTEIAAVNPAAANVALALHHAKTGKPDEAAALLTAALADTRDNDPQRRAWLDLQRGILAMDRGELQAAQDRLEAADAALGGWWLVQEHIAELHSRRDHHDKAIAIHEELVRTLELPQHMDALASLYRHMGQPQKAEALIARAAAKWEQQLARFPESAMGHALQHHLEFGAPERALELALANHALRPGGEAQVSLARAHLRAGQLTEALAVVERALASPYRTARLHDVAAKVHAALGNTAAAQAHISLRLAVNPRFTSDDHSH
jgi:tetratricopeptide (TPR) repeat protein